MKQMDFRARTKQQAVSLERRNVCRSSATLVRDAAPFRPGASICLPVRVSLGNLDQDTHFLLAELFACNGRPGILEGRAHRRSWQAPPSTDSSAVAWYMFIAPLIFALAVAFVSPDMALPAALVTSLLLWYRRRKVRSLPQCTLVVRNARLNVSGSRGRELLDVPRSDVSSESTDGNHLTNGR